MSRRACRLLPLLSALAAGCTPYPEDPLFAYGQVLRADGSPVSGATLTVDRGTNPSLLWPGGGVSPAPDFAPFTTVTTLDDGRFTLELTYADLDTYDSQDPRSYRFRVATPPDAQGQAVTGSFSLYGGDVELPPLRPWEARLAVAREEAGPTLTFAPAPASPELPPSARPPSMSTGDGDVVPQEMAAPQPVVQLLSGGALLWQAVDAHPPWTVSPYVLEDFAAEAQVRAVSLGLWSFEPLASLTSSSLAFRLEWRSGRVPLPAGTRVPVSRGAACLPPTDGPCPWTDGKLTPVVLAAGPVTGPIPETPPPTSEPVDTVGVTLAAPTRLSRAVVRGLQVATPPFEQQEVVVVGSPDGVTWTRLGGVPMHPENYNLYLQYDWNRRAWTTDSPYDVPLAVEDGPLFLDVPLTGEAPVRHVRVYLLNEKNTSGGVLSFAELSLFE